MARFKDIVHKLNRWVCYVGMVLLIPMMLLSSAEVVRRAVWSRPIPGTMELCSYMLAVFILLGVAYTQQVKGHVRVTMLVGRLPARARAAVEVFTIALTMFIVGILAWQGWVVAWEEKTVSDMLRIPQLPFRLLVFVAAVLLELELIVDMAGAIGRLKGARDG